jgi:uncharacterized protein
MATVPSKIMSVIQSYLAQISKEIPIQKAFLFGSYAKGTFDEESDVDLAIFSDYFQHKTKVEGITYLMLRAVDYPFDLQPIAFDMQEYEERLGLVEEIMETGVELK